MYLDHVTDSMLKGIGEHVYSMWVNIADSFLSVFLVWVLIPIFDISGYAMVIIAMELFNFTLSYLRLRKRIRFAFNPIRAIVIPLIAAIISIIVAKSAFAFTGDSASAFWLVMQIIFGACICIAILLAMEISKSYREIKA